MENDFSTDSCPSYDEKATEGLKMNFCISGFKERNGIPDAVSVLTKKRY
jgi:hypothetical protein